MFEAFAKKANTVGIETVDNLKFTKLAEHIGEELKIWGFFFNSSGKYGESVTVITSPETGVNLPKRYVPLFKGLADEEIAEITSGHVTLVNIRPIETKSGDSTTFEIKVEGV